MGNTNIPVAKRDFYLDLSALDGLSTKAAANLRDALRDFANAHGVAALKTALSTLNTENTTPVAPTNSVAPTKSGTTTVGQTLTGADGTWDNGFPSSVTTTRQWYRADTAGGVYTAIAGATNPTYVLAAGDSGKYLKFGVKKANASGELEVLSTATAQIAAA